MKKDPIADGLRKHQQELADQKAADDARINMERKSTEALRTALESKVDLSKFLLEVDLHHFWSAYHPRLSVKWHQKGDTAYCLEIYDLGGNGAYTAWLRKNGSNDGMMLSSSSSDVPSARSPDEALYELARSRLGMILFQSNDTVLPLSATRASQSEKAELHGRTSTAMPERKSNRSGGLALLVTIGIVIFILWIF